MLGCKNGMHLFREGALVACALLSGPGNLEGSGRPYSSLCTCPGWRHRPCSGWHPLQAETLVRKKGLLANVVMSLARRYPPLSLPQSPQSHPHSLLLFPNHHQSLRSKIPIQNRNLRHTHPRHKTLLASLLAGHLRPIAMVGSESTGLDSVHLACLSVGLQSARTPHQTPQ